MLIFGINPVLEALRAGRVTRLRVSARRDTRFDDLLAQAAKQGIAVERVETQALDRAARGGLHQGVVAEVGDVRACSISDLLPTAPPGPCTPPEASGTPLPGPRAPHAPARPALIVVLDGIEDPHNVGAIIRTVDAVGADGVVRQTRHAAALDGVVAKASAGALAHVKVASVVNVARGLEELKEAGVWTVGLAHDAPELYTEHDYRLPTALVLGAEGTGLRRLVRERCDRLVRIPMAGSVSSLNVSVAAGVVLYEAVRQRKVRS